MFEPAREQPSGPASERDEEFASEEGEEMELVDAELVDETTVERVAPSDDQGHPRKRRRRRRGGRRSKRDRRPADERAAQPPGEMLGEAEVEVPAPEFEAPKRALPGEERERKGRSRRRRRRGSGRKRDAERGAESEMPAEEGMLEEPEELATVGGEAGEEIVDEEEAGDSQLDKNSHRAIPAWEEAIGYIISVNMEGRAKNPKSGAPRGRGRGRGGSRGNA
jgi:hypothetical protein